jgi:hypothetical protein
MDLTGPVSKRQGGGIVVAALLLLSPVVGCQTNWHQNSHEFLQPYENGNYAQATTVVTKNAKNGVAHDKVLLRLEEGAILRAAGKLPESNAAFDAVDGLVGNYEEWPTVRLSEEAALALTTVRNANYRGNLTDLVFMNSYRALNAMELGQMEAARIALIRAAFVQGDIAAKYRSQLEQKQAQLDGQRKGRNYDADRTLKADVGGGMNVQQRVETSSQLAGMQPYADYMGPWADYLQGVFFLANANDASDRERAAVAFKRAAGMLQGNAYLAQDVAEVERVANGGQRSPVTYVFFETGLAPERRQEQIALPLFIIGHNVPSFVIAFPILSPRGNHAQSLTASAGGGTFQTEVVCDVDRVIGQEFKNNLSTTITRAVIAAVTKSAIDAATQQALKNEDPAVQLIAGIGMFVWQAAFNQADLRTWRTLPKQFQVARVPTPSDRQLSLRVADGTPGIVVQLPADGQVNVVYVKSVRAGVPPTVRTFKLR